MLNLLFQLSDIQEFYEATLLDGSKSPQQKAYETLEVAEKWETRPVDLDHREVNQHYSNDKVWKLILKMPKKNYEDLVLPSSSSLFLYYNFYCFVTDIFDAWTVTRTKVSYCIIILASSFFYWKSRNVYRKQSLLEI